VGQTREGIVRNIREFGAFVDLGGIDGLIHISQLSWDRIDHPSEVVKEGQTVQVKIEKIDAQTGKLSLSYRDLLEHPWNNVKNQFPVNSVQRGTVSKIAGFGAFVRLAAGIEGLVHISELAHQRIKSVASVVSEGQEIDVKVLSIDENQQRMSLSLKATLTAPSGASGSAEEDEEETPRELAVEAHNGPLKGGTNRSSGGEAFGLKW
ncbi:MAG: S1 RNA-binding domain-containing protein, partial [Pirellulaceae bacterium]|nr:S1 RNA-binding domain-containing protein [Pirellulaceae bacterium]